MVMLFASSGTGKSAVALYYAIKAQQPTLYLSADTDRVTTAERAAACLTGKTMEQIRREMVDPRGEEFYMDVIAEETGDYLFFSFDTSPSVEDILEETDAFALVHGEYPALLIVDNLKNVYSDGADEFGNLRNTMDELHQLAGMTQACVMVLHHSRNPDPKHVASKAEIYGKLDAIPELILSVARNDRELALAPVKNRNGKDDADGNLRFHFHIDLDRMVIEEPHILAMPGRPRLPIEAAYAEEFANA